MGETQVGPQARREYLGRMRERYEQARSASVHVLRRLWMTPARARAGRHEKKGAMKAPCFSVRFLAPLRLFFGIDALPHSSCGILGHRARYGPDREHPAKDDDKLPASVAARIGRAHVVYGGAESSQKHMCR